MSAHTKKPKVQGGSKTIGWMWGWGKRKAGTKGGIRPSELMLKTRELKERFHMLPFFLRVHFAQSECTKAQLFRLPHLLAMLEADRAGKRKKKRLDSGIIATKIYHVPSFILQPRRARGEENVRRDGGQPRQESWLAGTSSPPSTTARRASALMTVFAVESANLQRR